jgi:hypothetical protein
MTRGPILLAAPAPITTRHTGASGTGQSGQQWWLLKRSTVDHVGTSSSGGAGNCRGGSGLGAGSNTPTRRALFKNPVLTTDEAYKMGPTLLASGGDGLLVLSLLTGLTTGACLGWLWLLGHR